MIETLPQMLMPLALAALLHAAHADTSTRPVRTLPPVEVAAERARLDARRRMPTGDVTELRVGDAAHASATAGDLLATTVGARVVQYGGAGSFATVSLRGAAPGQVSVFLDGVPLSSAADGAVNLGDLPVAALDRIEIYRGSAPLALGTATPGGAVQLVSEDGASVRRMRVATGSFGTWEGGGTFAGARGALALLAHAGGESSRGDYRFRDDNGTPFNTADDAIATRINSRYDAAHALARLAWTPGALGRVVLRAEGNRSAQGVPGLGAAQAPNPRLARERGQLALEMATAGGERAPRATLRAHVREERSQFRDSEGELRLGRQDGTSTFDETGGTFELATPNAWRWLDASAGAETRDERAAPAPPTLGFVAPPPTTRATTSAWLGVQLHAWNDALLVHAARRWDRQRDRVRATLVGGVAWASDAARTLDAPQLGARVKLPRGLEARTSWSRSARAPGFSELFGDGAIVAASPKLVPEHGESWDAGGAWHGAGRDWRGDVECTYYATHERDLVNWVPAAQRTVRAENFARAEITGTELVASGAWRAFDAALASAWTNALQTDRGNIYYGRRLPLRPAHQTSLRLAAHRGAWRVALDGLELGDDYLDPINFQRLPGRTLVGASLTRAWRALTVTLEGRNLGDRHVQDVAGYPLPGRSAWLACEWHAAP